MSNDYIVVILRIKIRNSDNNIQANVIIMSNKNQDNTKERKRRLFEYLVFKLDLWRQQEKKPLESFTKLRLQKLLFLVSTVNSSSESHPLLEIFNKFYAMPYGPVEMDIYNAMLSNRFESIKFEGINCKLSYSHSSDFNSIEENLRLAVDQSIDSLKSFDFDYISGPVYKLVEITHKWSAWQIAIELAKITGNHKEIMTTADICNSYVKAFT